MGSQLATDFARDIEKGYHLSEGCLETEKHVLLSRFEAHQHAFSTLKMRHLRRDFVAPLLWNFPLWSLIRNLGHVDRYHFCNKHHLGLCNICQPLPRALKQQTRLQTLRTKCRKALWLDIPAIVRHSDTARKMISWGAYRLQGTATTATGYLPKWCLLAKQTCLQASIQACAGYSLLLRTIASRT